MPSFSSPGVFKEHKTYVPLLKKALLTVKPGTQRKFLYFKQYPFGQKKLPLVLVDYDPNCQAALAKTGFKPTAEGLVSLTEKDELNFEAKKGELKRSRIHNYFAMIGGGIKPVYVPSGETDEADTATVTATLPTASAAPADPAAQAKELLARVEHLRNQAFPPAVDKVKGKALDKAKALVQAGKLAPATMLLNELASKALPSTQGEAAAAAEGSKAVDPVALKWDRWFREKPLWPQSLTKSAWDKNKGALAKLTFSTGIGDQLKACEASFSAAAAKMPLLKGKAPADIAASSKDCQAFMADSAVKKMCDDLKGLGDLARQASADSKKNPVIPRSTTQLCDGIASVADALMVFCQPNALKGCLDAATRANDAGIQLDKAWRLDDLKTEKDPAKRIELCQKLLDENPERSPQRDSVEDILAQALKDQGVGKAGDAYATQMRDDKNKFYPKNLVDKYKVFKSDKILKDAMQKTGLSEAEVIAIRTFTAEDYKYINPAVANQKDRADKTDATGKRTDWMNTNRPSKVTKNSDKALETYEKGSVAEKGSKKGLYEEGALHAGVMMEAFKKLPKKAGKVYRGTRMTPEEFKKAYKVGKVVSYESFASQTTDIKRARYFAKGQLSPRAGATVSVLIEADVVSGRDIANISSSGADEAEVLLGPGTKLRVERIESDTEKEPGSPPATEWKKVFLTEVVDG